MSYKSMKILTQDFIKNVLKVVKNAFWEKLKNNYKSKNRFLKYAVL